MNAQIPTLSPRKSPLQARSTVTVEALHDAAIQVLKKEGLARCTTTRIAERAGMSVGSLYQYYPNRDALLAVVLESHIEGVVAAVEAACREQRGTPLSRMAAALVTTFLAAKLHDPDKSKALYAVAEEHGGAELVARGRGRMVAAVAGMLATAPGARFDDPAMAAMMVLSAIAGPIQILLEGSAPAGFEMLLGDELVLLVTAYLEGRPETIKALQ